MQMKERIEMKLRDHFKPVQLEVIDDSAAHKGHAGAPDGGESHFKVHIVAEAFAGQSRVAKHRMVYAVLKEEMQKHIHALNIDASAP